MSEDDIVRLRHMLDASRAAVNFVQGQTRTALDSNQMLLFALLRAIEIVGEAASRITDEVQDEQKQIPWAQIIGMRNRLIHGYFDIDHDRVWKTATEDIPSLIVELEKIIPPEQEI